jgi:hypothetical protein
MKMKLILLIANLIAITALVIARGTKFKVENTET